MKSIKKCTILILVILLLYLVFFKPKKNDNIIYIENFLDENDYINILSLDKNKDNFMYEKFRYIKPLKNGFTYDIFYNKKYMDKVQRYINTKIYPSDFPIEHRFYHKESAGMDWHKDTLLYTKPQYEAIFTITNNSESKTQWEDGFGNRHELWTKPNSLLIVKAQGYKHHVTPPISGEREILKLIYTQTNDVNSNYHKEIERFNKFKI